MSNDETTTDYRVILIFCISLMAFIVAIMLGAAIFGYVMGN